VLRDIIGDRYVPSDFLGAGGMAEVFLVHDRMLGRNVALKVLREHYAKDLHFVERFRREAQSAAALSHPNVVQVYDQGRSEDGRYYIAMEYVPGGTLGDRIGRVGPLNSAEAARLASQVAEALRVAHERGIVHRDIKPQNVLLDAAGEAKVADFGIALAASSTSISRTNQVFGTAGYMSPEQAMGEPVGPPSDLYSLGAVLYEMLTGTMPFEAEGPLATAMKHVTEQPLPRGSATLRSQRGWTPW
jgi:eukaryotic-like serine/threonine-protein kinase